FYLFFSSRSRHTRFSRDWSSDVCSSDLCNCAIQGDDILLIEDTQHDKKFSTHPYVTGDPHIRFYAGVPLKTHYNQRIGTLCLIEIGRASCRERESTTRCGDRRSQE